MLIITGDNTVRVKADDAKIVDSVGNEYHLSEIEPGMVSLSIVRHVFRNNGMNREYIDALIEDRQADYTRLKNLKPDASTDSILSSISEEIDGLEKIIRHMR